MQVTQGTAALAALIASIAMAAPASAKITATTPGHTIVVANNDGSDPHVVGHGDRASFVSPNLLEISDAVFPKPVQTQLRLVKLQGTRAVGTRTLPCTAGAGFVEPGRIGCIRSLPKNAFRDVVVTLSTGRVVAMPKNCQPVAWIAKTHRLLCSQFLTGRLELASTITGRVKVFARNVRDAELSPDRKRVTVITKTGRLKLLTIATGRSRLVPTSYRVFNAAWSPNMKRLAFTTSANPFGLHQRLTIRTLASGASKLLPTVGVNSLEWMSSQRLLFTFSPTTFSAFNWASVRANGTGLVQLTHLGALPGDQFGFIAGVAWTPDFKHLGIDTDAFDDTTNADVAVGYAVNPTGGGFHVLAQGQVRIGTIGPDGLVYGSTDTHFIEDSDPTPFDVIRVGFAPGAKPQVLIRHASHPSFSFTCCKPGP